MRDLATKFAGYVLSGGAAAVVDAGGFVLFLHVGLTTVPAAIMSFGIAAAVNFLLSAQFVFKQKRSYRGFLTFLAAALAGLAVNVSVTVAVAVLLGVPPILAKIVGIGMAFSLNFVLNLRVVFRSREAQ